MRTGLAYAVSFVVLLCSHGNACGESYPKDHAAKILSGIESDESIAPLSASTQNMSAELAYNIQRDVVAARLETQSIGGLKAGLTGPGGQKIFGATGPVFGVLFTGGIRDQAPAPTELATNRTPLIEAEIALFLNADVPDELASTDDLIPHIRGFAPAVELPVVTSKLNGAGFQDLIAENVGSRHVVVGEERPFSEWGNTPIIVDMSRDSATVVDRVSPDKSALLQTALELVNWANSSQAKQYASPKAGYVLILGAIGGVQPRKPGHWVADFGKLGTIEVEAPPPPAPSTGDKAQ